MLASLTPCLRHKSATETPASWSFNIPMICSSEKRLRFMLWSSCWARANFKLDQAKGARSNPLQSLNVTCPAVVDPASGEPVRAVIGTTVRAPSCLLADALTKIAMAGGPSAAPLLRQFAAAALFVSAEGEVYTTPEWRDA